MPMSKPRVLEWSSKKKTPKGQKYTKMPPFSHSHGRKRHFPPEPSILGVSLKNLLKESPYKKWPSAWGEQLLFVGTVGPRLGFPTSPMVGAKFFSLPVSLERPLGEIWTNCLVVILTPQDSIVANQGLVWDSRSPKKLFQKSWWWRGNRKPHAGWGGVDPTYNWYFG